MCEKWYGKKLIAYMLIYSEEMLDERLQNNTKLMWQIRAFEKIGLDVWYVLYGRDGIYLCNKETKEKIANSVGGYRGFIHRHFMNKALLKNLKKYGPFDYAYIRQMVSLPSFTNVLKALHKQGTKVMMEIPTYSKSKINEDANSGRWFRVAIAPIMKKMRENYAKYLDLYVLLGEHETMLNGVPAINISNGMNALVESDLPVRNHRYNDSEYHLLVLGHMRFYHGVERILQGMREYYFNGGEAKVYLHVVGLDADGCLESCKKYADSNGLSDKFILEGFCLGEKLNRACDKCDIAFGGLAYYLKGGIIGTELKTKEYFSRGIPFVLAVPDESVPKDAEYVMYVSNDDTAIDINKIIEFVDELKKDNMLQEKMQDYALNNMTWMSEFEKVMRAIEEK